MTAPIVLTLPEPPSANRYWRHVVIHPRGGGASRAGTYISEEAKLYKLVAYNAWVVSRHRPISGEISLTMQWYRGRKSGDLDNRIKQLLDALKGLAFTDDADIVELHAERYDGIVNAGHVIVTIEPARVRQEALAL